MRWLQTGGTFGETTTSGFGLQDESRQGSSLGSQGYTPLTGTPTYTPPDFGAGDSPMPLEAGVAYEPAHEPWGLEAIAPEWSGEAPPGWGVRGRWGAATPEWGNTRRVVPPTVPQGVTAAMTRACLLSPKGTTSGRPP